MCKRCRVFGIRRTLLITFVRKPKNKGNKCSNKTNYVLEWKTGKQTSLSQGIRNILNTLYIMNSNDKKKHSQQYTLLYVQRYWKLISKDATTHSLYGSSERNHKDYLCNMWIYLRWEHGGVGGGRVAHIVMDRTSSIGSQQRRVSFAFCIL